MSFEFRGVALCRILALACTLVTSGVPLCLILAGPHIIFFKFAQRPQAERNAEEARLAAELQRRHQLEAELRILEVCTPGCVE